MFGCGHFPVNEMLLYIEGKSGQAGNIESHLKNCRQCLEEVMEQNRVNSKTSAFKAIGMINTFFINLLINAGSVIRALSTEGDIKFVPVAATRSGKGKAQKVIYTIDSIPASISIFAAGNGSCRFIISSPSLKSAAVEIRKKGDNLPLYSKKSDSAEVTFNGIKPGDYIISFRKNIIQVVVRKGLPA